MHKYCIRLTPKLVCICLVLCFSSSFGQNHKVSATIDLQKARVIIDSLDKQFANHYLNGDSVAIYSMYAKNAEFESLKGKEILDAWGKQIRNSIASDTRALVFTTTSLSTDSEFLVELGTYEIKDSKGNTKHSGKYLVVWKQENGTWKLYRDMGL